MKNKTYILNTFLAIVLGIYLLTAVIVRTFCPQIILPKANIPNMVLIGLIALVLDHYLAPEAKRCYICIPVFSAITFGLLPYAAELDLVMALECHAPTAIEDPSLRRCESAVLINILRIHPSKWPSPR